MPDTFRRVTRDIARAISEFIGEFCRKPTAEELAAEMGIEVDKLGRIQSRNLPILSLDKKRHFIDLVPDENDDIPFRESESVGLKNEIISALDKLNPQQARVLKLYFGIDGEEHSLKEIAKNLGVTESRISQIRKAALNKLKESSGKQLAEYYPPAHQ